MTGVREAATDVAVEKECASFYGDIVVREEIFSLSELTFGVLDAVIEFGPAGAYFIRADLRAKILKKISVFYVEVIKPNQRRNFSGCGMIRIGGNLRFGFGNIDLQSETAENFN